MANKFNVADLYLKAFGIKGVRFAIPEIPEILDYALQGSYDLSGIESVEFPQAKAMSVLGTPIYEQIVLSLPGVVEYTFPGWPLFSITGQKIIVKTPMQNRRGTVKEYISDDDYSITIRGFLINENSQAFPAAQLEDLMQVIRINKPIRITSEVFNQLDIHNIVIESYRFPEVEGFPNMQPFELECLSDEPVEIIIQSTRNKNSITPGL